jgi:iron(III)-salmochelin esterase
MKKRSGSEQPSRATRAPALLLIAITASLTLSCERSPPRVEADAPEREVAADATALVSLNEGREGAGNGAKRRELTWTFDEGAFGPTDVVLSIPIDADANARFPVLIALHGRGESLKGSRRGARGWIDDYELDRAMQRLSRPPLRARDFEGYVSRERLRRINRALVGQPYSGLIVVCPFLPDVLRRENAFKEAEPLAAFIVDVLLPRVYATTPALATPASTGIDGVSLGGRAALLVGFARPRAFGAVGALQAAIDGTEIERFAELGARALADNPNLSLRLLTSDKDHFLRVNEQLSAELKARGVQHRYSRVQGNHSYRFNRGPGALEMLLFHDRTLRGTAWD